MNIYCVRCKSKTANKGKSAIVATKNGRRTAKTHCAKCGTQKCQFVASGQSGKGIFGDFVNFVAPIAGSVAGAAYGNPALGMSLGNIAGGLGKRIPF